MKLDRHTFRFQARNLRSVVTPTKPTKQTKETYETEQAARTELTTLASICLIKKQRQPKNFCIIFCGFFHTHTQRRRFDTVALRKKRREEKNNIKRKTKSSFYFVSLISVEDKQKKSY